MKIGWDGIEWFDNFYYVYWWNWLPKGHRFIGLDNIFYDGPIGRLDFGS